MIAVSPVAKRGYVAAMRAARGAARRAGLLRRPAPLEAGLAKHWLQSLFAIYDIEELVALDVPWWTYDAIKQVDDFLRSRHRSLVFEYGSGASTIWLAKRAYRVTSVDHDPSWVARLRPRLASLDNITLELAPPDKERTRENRFHSNKAGYRGCSFRDYVEAIGKAEGPFDLIIIDGRARSACLNEAVRHLAPGGLVVFDNSHRRRYRYALRSCGLARVVTRGLVPSLPFPDETTLLRAE